MAAVGLALGSRVMPGRLVLAGMLCAVLPDVDVAGFIMNVPYGEVAGHRGASHSLLWAAVAGVICGLAAPWLRCGRLVACLTGFLAVASHIVLDAATNGGLGVAAFWPWDNTRYFLSWRPIEVSPLGLRRFFSPRGLEVMLSEFTYIWLPCLGAALFIAALRKAMRPRLVS